MKICPQCDRQNPDIFYCASCGCSLRGVAPEGGKSSLWKRLPSWAWILLGLAAIALFLSLITGSFVLLAKVEGFGSVLVLTAGIYAGRVFSRTPPHPDKLMRALAISFFALMGACIDQPGNFLYNKPIEWIFCPADSHLSRELEVSHPLPDKTYMIQEFTCQKDGSALSSIHPLFVFLLRFAEYVLIAYLLIFARWSIWNWRQSKARPAS